MAVIPTIAFIGIVGKANNPLHIALFPTSSSPIGPPSPKSAGSTKPTYLLTPLSTSLLLSTTLDIFEARAKANAITGQNLTSDYGLLKNVDERLGLYGWETNTGVKFVVGIDVRGRIDDDKGSDGRKRGSSLGVRDGEVKVVFRAIQAAYVRLLQNPFFDPDEHSPSTGRGGKEIESRKFMDEIRRIGDQWRVGMTVI